MPDRAAYQTIVPLNTQLDEWKSWQDPDFRPIGGSASAAASWIPAADFDEMSVQVTGVTGDITGLVVTIKVSNDGFGAATINGSTTTVTAAAPFSLGITVPSVLYVGFEVTTPSTSAGTAFLTAVLSRRE